jgi:ribosomal protein S18 acetylase RimI-like enzyme
MYTAVSLAARGHGVARELLAEMVHVANRRGLSAVRGENEADPRLSELYERVGFKVVATMTALDGSHKLVTYLDVAEGLRLLASAGLPPL